MIAQDSTQCTKERPFSVPKSYETTSEPIGVSATQAYSAWLECNRAFEPGYEFRVVAESEHGIHQFALPGFNEIAIYQTFSIPVACLLTFEVLLSSCEHIPTDRINGRIDCQLRNVETDESDIVFSSSPHISAKHQRPAMKCRESIVYPILTQGEFELRITHSLRRGNRSHWLRAFVDQITVSSCTDSYRLNLASLGTFGRLSGGDLR